MKILSPDRRWLTLLLPMSLAAAPARAQDIPERHGFWAGVQFGYGSLEWKSEQETLQRRGVFAMSFRLGLTPLRCLQIGVELNGWLLEPFDMWDPSQGESVSQTLLIAQVYPWPARGWFVKAGVGEATYTNEAPFAFDSRGTGATIGVGFDWFVSRSFALTPVLSYSRGGLGGVMNPLVTITNREYEAIDFGVAFTSP